MGQLGVRKRKEQPMINTEGIFRVIFDQAMPQDSRIIKIACGSEHSMALTSGGDLFTWGWGEHGNLGHGTKANEYYPRLVTNLGAANGYHVRNIATGGAVVFALISCSA